MDKNLVIIASELQIPINKVIATTTLLDEGATVPFISRYRKEITGSLDEVEITQIRDRVIQLRELDKRRQTILKTIEEQGKLTDALKSKIDQATTMSELEDIYLPYKPKRRTRATIAREKGLEPLANLIWENEGINLESAAAKFLNNEKEVTTIDEALAGARDIIAERINENPEARKNIRNLFEKEGKFVAKVIPGKEQDGQKFRDYFDWSEDIKNAPSHRVLAMRRAEKEMIISFDCTPEEEQAVFRLEKQFVTSASEIAQQIKLAVKDGYKRLMKPSMETEIRLMTKKRADEEAIKVFADNLRQLLLAAPMGQKAVLALDPGFRSGCKLVVLDAQGKLLDNTAIYPNEPQKKIAESGAIVKMFCEKYKIEAIAIGNGTASRETENFVQTLGLPKAIQVIMVNESGASIYSASEVAREEFPDHDVTVRGAISIGRRLMDPLAELVKLDPKSIGVGQYQHDVDQNALKSSLDDVVISAVNKVGVEVNTASKELLTYVSGLNAGIAKNIVKFREENGPFTKRSQFKKVARLGDKAYEQAAGFLRINTGNNPLDASSVHPESYYIVEQMAKDLGCSVSDLMKSNELRNKIDLKKYVSDKVGMPTLTDIVEELAKPGRDPREAFEAFSFDDSVHEMKDLTVGMELPGIITNITNFGAFVDIGVHQDGLVHLSQMSHQFIKHPNEVVKVHQQVQVTITEVDINRKRIALSMVGEKKKSATPKTKGPNKDNVRAPKPRAERPQKQEENLSMEDKLKMLQSKFKLG